MRPINVMLWFCQLETSGQIIFIFCSHCFSYHPAPAEPLEFFLVMEYSLKYLHKLLKQRDDGKTKGECSQTSLIEGKNYHLLGHSLGYHQNFDFYGLHTLGNTERHSASDAESQGRECGVCSMAFPDSYVSKRAGGVNFSFVTLIVLWFWANHLITPLLWVYHLRI